MPKKQYAMERGGEKRITAEWKGMWNDFTLKVDGEEILRAETKSRLTTGADGRLPDGRPVRAWLDGVGLAITIDGAPVPGSTADGYERLSGAWGIMFVVAAFTGCVGILAEVMSIRFLLEMGFGWPAILSGVFMAVLAHIVRVKQSKIALGIGVAFFAIDGVILLGGVLTGGGFPIFAIVMRVAIIVAMCKGFAAIDMIRAQRKGA